MKKSFVAGLIALPSPIKAGITAVVLYVVSFVFANLVVLVPFLAFLEQFKIPLAGSIAIAVIAWIEKVVPELYGKVAVAALTLILAVLSVFGVGVELAAQLPSLLAP